IKTVFVLLAVMTGQANRNHQACGFRHWDNRRPLHEHSGDHWPSNTNAMPSGQYRPLATEQQAPWSTFAMTPPLELKSSNGMRPEISPFRWSSVSPAAGGGRPLPAWQAVGGERRPLASSGVLRRSPGARESMCNPRIGRWIEQFLEASH